MSDAVEWLTYDEAAKRLGMTRGSVRNRSQRKRWPRKVGNDGLARIGVPVAELEARSTARPEAGSGAGSEAGSAAVAVQEQESTALRLARLEGEIAALRELVEAERKRADAEALRASSLTTDRDAWRSLAERSWWRRLVG